MNDAVGMSDAGGAPAKPGRKPPVPYSESLADVICERLADGESLNSICSTDDMPTERAVRLWAADPGHPFAPRYARAREVGWLRMADEILEIADDSRNDWMDQQRGEETVRVVDHEAIKRAQLRVDTRKWLLSKCLPKVYGDRIEADITSGGKPLAAASDLDIAKALVHALLAARALPAPEPIEVEAVPVEAAVPVSSNMEPAAPAPIAPAEEFDLSDDPEGYETPREAA